MLSRTKYEISCYTIYTLNKKVRDHNFQYPCFGHIKLDSVLNTSVYVAIIWLSFDKNLTVLSKSQTELRSVKYGNPQNEVYRSMEDNFH